MVNHKLNRGTVCVPALKAFLLQDTAILTREAAPPNPVRTTSSVCKPPLRRHSELPGVALVPAAEFSTPAPGVFLTADCLQGVRRRHVTLVRSRICRSAYDTLVGDPRQSSVQLRFSVAPVTAPGTCKGGRKNFSLLGNFRLPSRKSFAPKESFV